MRTIGEFTPILVLGAAKRDLSQMKHGDPWT